MCFRLATLGPPSASPISLQFSETDAIPESHALAQGVRGMHDGEGRMNRLILSAGGLVVLLLLAGAAGGAVQAGQAEPAGSETRNRYGFEFFEALEASRRGEAREALSYYEREAARLEGHGVQPETARAHAAVAFVALRLGAYQKVIRSGLRALELLKLEPPSEETLGRQLGIYSHVGQGYRRVGDLQEARRYFQEGLDLAQAAKKTQRVLFFSAVFSKSLAQVAAAEGDSPAVLRRGADAVQFMERYLAGLGAARAPGGRGDRWGRWGLVFSNRNRLTK